MVIIKAPLLPACPMVPVVVERRSMKETAPVEYMAELFTGEPFGLRIDMSVPTPPPKE